jgi:hypothetical protein
MSSMFNWVVSGLKTRHSESTQGRLSRRANKARPCPGVFVSLPANLPQAKAQHLSEFALQFLH